MLRLSVMSMLILVIFVSSGVATPALAAHSGIVTWIYDGDTIKVKNVGIVRLIGVDCPEKKDNGRDRKFIRLGCKNRRVLRHSARDTLKTFIRRYKGQRVRVEVGGDKRDHYGRVLGYVWLPNGTMLNRLLLKEGRAMVYRRFDFKHKREFLRLEQQARRHHVGLWHR